MKTSRTRFCDAAAVSAGAVCDILGYGIAMAVDEAGSNGVFTTKIPSLTILMTNVT
jgi:hypothetical protein